MYGTRGVDLRQVSRLLALMSAVPEIAWAGTAVTPVWREVVGIPGAAWSPLPVRRLVT